MNGETRLLLLRHGRLRNSADGVINGQRDEPLTPEGVDDVMRWAGMLAAEPPAAVLSSDLSRCRVPAGKIAERLGLPHVLSEGLREIHAGAFEGLRYADVMATDASFFERRLADLAGTPFPGGESLADLQNRVVASLTPLIGQYQGSRVLVVTHAGVIRTAVLHLLGLPLDRFFALQCDFGGMTTVRLFDDGNAVLESLNVTTPPPR